MLLAKGMIFARSGVSTPLLAKIILGLYNPRLLDKIIVPKSVFGSDYGSIEEIGWAIAVAITTPTGRPYDIADKRQQTDPQG